MPAKAPAPGLFESIDNPGVRLVCVLLLAGMGVVYLTLAVQYVLKESVL